MTLGIVNKESPSYIQRDVEYICNGVSVALMHRDHGYCTLPAQL